MNHNPCNAFITETSRPPETAIGWRERFLFVSQCLAVPTLFVALWFFANIADHAVPRPDTFHVIEKAIPAPDRFTIGIKTEPNENGGTLAIFESYPKWLFDCVQVGDTFQAGFCHFRVSHNGRFTALYIPWHKIFPLAFIPIVWVIPAFSLTRWLSWTQSISAIALWITIELSCFAAVSWVALVGLSNRLNG